MKHRVCTTISAKHWELLKKYAAEYETQQKALEAALESLENGPKQKPGVSDEERFWQRMKELKAVVHLHKDLFHELVRTMDIDRINMLITKLRLAEYQIASYIQKPLTECSLKEVMDGLIVSCRLGNWFDTIEYIDEGSHYTLRITHSMGDTKLSNGFEIFFQSLFKAYGVKAESKISVNSIFIKVYKDVYPTFEK